MADKEAIQSRNMPPSTPLTSPSPMRPLQLSGFICCSLYNSISKANSFLRTLSLLTLRAHLRTPQYMTPIATEEDQSDQFIYPLVRENCTFVGEGNTCESETSKNRDSTVVTRLRSGVISSMTYFPPRNSVALGKLRGSDQKVKSKKKSGGKVGVFERVLRRRSCPVRPCTSYTFFVMDTWDQFRSPTFGETSKRLGRMWCQLPHKEKKLYQEMAMKDNARYKMQCTLLKSKSSTELK